MANYTTLTDLRVTGKLVALGGAGLGGVVDKSMTADTTLDADEAGNLVIKFTCSAASKSLVLGIADGQVMLVYNYGGTNAVTVKPITGDTGTSVAAGKVALVIGGSGANKGTVLVLN